MRFVAAKRIAGLLPGAAAALALSSLPLAAQDASQQGISIELNGATEANGGCQLSFVAVNQSAATIEKIAYEMAIFDAQKRVQLLVMDFRRLVAGRTRVQVFDLPNRSCSDISSITVNDVTECVVGGQPSEVCSLDNLKTSTRASVGFS